MELLTGDVASVTPAAVLDHVLDGILTDDTHWTQGAAARTSHNDRVEVDSIHAEKFCMVGAIRKATCDLLGISHIEGVHMDLYWDLTWRAEAAVRGVLPDGNPTIPPFNDAPETTFEDVRLVLKEAREKAANA